MSTRLQGLIAATHTPFDSDGNVNLAAISRQAEHLSKTGVGAVFVSGTTGESASLTLEERIALIRRWADVTRGTSLKLIVHVGGNCIEDARTLATLSQTLNAFAISAVAPTYFKPRDLEATIACCARIASGAPLTPFYYYDIPVMTGMNQSMPDFLVQAPAMVPTLSGLKFTNADLMAYQKCLAVAGGKFDVPYGFDEQMLAALVLGATGFVGSSFNFAAPIYTRLISAFQRNDLAAARAEQMRSVQVITLVAKYGYMAAAKHTMKLLGVDVGKPRLPSMPLTAEQEKSLQAELSQIGFFDWLKPQ
jgi:N-acetylneuraminate lyase